MNTVSFSTSTLGRGFVMGFASYAGFYRVRCIWG